MADTGNTATLAFSGGFTASYMEVGGTEQEIPKIKTSHLGTTTNEEYIPGDLYEPGEFECEFQFDPTAAALPPIGAVQTVTITYPIATGDMTGGTLAGTGFILKRTTAQLKNNELMMGKLTVAWDGLTGPTYTAGS